MLFDDDKVKEVLQKLPSEGPQLDYKVKPYSKEKNQDFLKDIISMLNSEAAAGEDKFIIIGVEDERKALVGITMEEWRDDTEWQDLIDKISPRPDVRTGYVSFEDKTIGYFYIPASNKEWVYEAAETVISSNPDQKLKGKSFIAKGQAYIRVGSRNEVLMSDGRKRLMERRNQPTDSFLPINLPISIESIEKRVFQTLALIGGWNETFVGDAEVIKKLSGIDYHTFKETVRRLFDQKPGHIKYLNGRWSLADHKGSLFIVAKAIFDEHIDMLFDALQSCYSEEDPVYELIEIAKSDGQSRYQERSARYSAEIKQGLSETMAILGNNMELFEKCSRYKISNSIYAFEREFFRTKNWKIYASVAEYLHFLGEACPKAFMSEIKRLLLEKDEAFNCFLTKDSDYYTSSQHGYLIFNILANIAADETCFSEAMETLFMLAKLRSEIIDIIVGIVIPWYPQTNASVEMRVGFFRGVFDEDSELAWTILMKLMPRVTTTVTPIQKPSYLKTPDLPESVTPMEYSKATIEYIRLANEFIGNDIGHMCSMVSVLDDVDDKTQKEILEAIGKGAKGIAETEKYILWNRLQDFLHMHRTYSDTNWTLDEDRLVPIEAFANQLQDKKEFSVIRLFRKDQYSLLDGIENYADGERKLKERQIETIKEIYGGNGVEGIKLLLERIENKKVAGVVSGSLLKDNDIRYFITESKNILADDFVGGLILSNPFERNKEIISDFSDVKKAQVLSKMVLSDKIIGVVSELNEEAQKCFWKEVTLLGSPNDELSKADDAIINLNKNHRTDKSMAIIYNRIRTDSDSINVGLVIDTLLLNAELQKESMQNEFYIKQIIKWLQSRNIERESALKIEWEYLGFLRRREGCSPVTLWDELSTNPMYYVEIVKIITGKECDPNWSVEEKKRIAEHGFSLLYGWKKMPGLDELGVIDKERLENWLSTVKQLSQQYEIESSTMYYFGRTTFYAPADKDGFFINRSVAKILQEDKMGYILSGYYSEAIDSSGPWVDESGEAEFKLEAEYYEKAKKADENGYFRLAQRLRSLASRYHEEGLRNKEGF